jgi:hypothetical protein
MKSISTNILVLILSVIFISCGNNKSVDQKNTYVPDSCQSDSKATSTIAKEDGVFTAHKTLSPLQIDGCSKDSIWSKVDWYSMNYIWMGEAIDSTDYQGRFKLAWDSEYLYVLVEVVDDYLNPTLENGIENYWKGDYVEVFIDEDQSGGMHQYNHQAFAYHVSTEGHAIDKNTSQETVFFDDHINVERSQEGNKYLWEMRIKLFDQQFDENSTENIPVRITDQKRIGFSIAYGDNDGNNSRENFMGSKKAHGINNDEGYINSDVFGSILFTD